MSIVLQLAVIFLIPYLITLGQRRFKIIRSLSPILLCYGIGILWGVLEGLPLDRDLSMSISEICVPLAIPLILFSADFKKFIRSAKPIVVAFMLMVVAILTSSVVTALLFSHLIPEAAKISGMLIGCYTGGTPNLMAVGLALGVKEETLILVNTSDAILGGAFFLIVISVFKPLLSKFLKPYKHLKTEEEFVEKTYFIDLEKKEKKKAVKESSILLLVCVGILGLSVGIAMLLTGKMDVAIIMLLVTTAGVGGSFIKKVRNVRYTYENGQYIILVFSLALGTTVNIKDMLSATPNILMYVAITMFGAVFLHMILAKIFKIDVDTAIITMTAGVYGPAFVVPAADAIKNKEVIVAGLTCGLVGYAIGNYLGYLVYYIVTLIL